MAEKLEEAVEGEQPKKKSKLPLIIIAVVLLAGGGGGAFWFMSGSKPADGAAKKEAPSKPPIYVKLDVFTVNLLRGETDSDDHYLQVELNLKVQEDKVNEALKLRMPEIRNALLLLFSSKTQGDLATLEGKKKLSDEIVVQINKIIGSKDPAKDGVLGVYFTSFIIQ